jgi:hypothetical protein
LDDETFFRQYYKPQKPVVMKDLAKRWPAFDTLNWGFFKSIVAEQEVAYRSRMKIYYKRRPCAAFTVCNP